MGLSENTLDENGDHPTMSQFSNECDSRWDAQGQENPSVKDMSQFSNECDSRWDRPKGLLRAGVGGYSCLNSLTSAIQGGTLPSQDARKSRLPEAKIRNLFLKLHSRACQNGTARWVSNVVSLTCFSPMIYKIGKNLQPRLTKVFDLTSCQIIFYCIFTRFYRILYTFFLCYTRRCRPFPSSAASTSTTTG